MEVDETTEFFQEGEEADEAAALRLDLAQSFLFTDEPKIVDAERRHVYLPEEDEDVRSVSVSYCPGRHVFICIIYPSAAVCLMHGELSSRLGLYLLTTTSALRGMGHRRMTGTKLESGRPRLFVARHSNGLGPEIHEVGSGGIFMFEATDLGIWNVTISVQQPHAMVLSRFSFAPARSAKDWHARFSFPTRGRHFNPLCHALKCLLQHLRKLG